MSQVKSKIFRSLGTVNTITIYDPFDDDVLKRAADRVLELDDCLSVFQPDSEISRINAAAGKGYVSVSPDTMQLLKTAQRFSELSMGAFDITARPLIALWRMGAQQGTVPKQEEIEQARLLVDYRDLILNEADCTVMLRRQGQSIDLGGIAKGYAADEVRRILIEGGITNALLNLGGTVVVMGETRTIGVQHPRQTTGEPMGRLPIQNKAVVTSGDYERYFEHNRMRYHHIIDTRTGFPTASGLCGVTVVGECAMELDALSTAMFVLGMEKGAQLAEQLGVEAIFVTDQLDVLCTPGLQGNFSLI